MLFALSALNITSLIFHQVFLSFNILVRHSHIHVSFGMFPKDCELSKGPYTPGRISARVICVHTQAIFTDDEPSEHANSFPDIRWHLN